MCLQRLHFATIATAVLVCSAAPALAAKVTFARDVSVSPDGGQIAFSWAGDIWTVPIAGGRATRLTVHPANDDHPIWSRDGKRLAFASDRFGSHNVFTMRVDGTDVRRLTFADRDEIPTDWTTDDAGIYFHARREGDPFPQPRVYRVPADGGQSWRVMDCFGGSAKLSPRGNRLAFIRGRTPRYRRHYRGSANYDLHLWTVGTDAFAQLTDFDGTDRMPAWSADGSTLYYLSDRGGSMNVWKQPIEGGKARQITRMTGEDVREFAVSGNGKTLVFTHWDEIYVMDTNAQVARVIEVFAGDDAQQTDIDYRTYTNDADELEVSPDGKEIALVVHGELFIAKTDDKAPTRRMTRSPARDHDIVWSPDGKAIFFVSDHEGQEDIYRVTSAEDPAEALSDSLRFTVERVTDDPAIESRPQISPDGKSLSFIRGAGNLIIRDLEKGTERSLLDGWYPPLYRWSPDSKWIAYQTEDREHNPDVWIVPADGSAPAVNISQHPDYDGQPQWSADGQMLAFSSRRHGFDSDLYVVFLSRSLDELPSIERDEYFEKQSKAVRKRKPLKEAAASGKIVLAGEKPETQPADTQPSAESQPTTAPTTQPTTEPTETQPTSAPATQPAEDDLRGQVRQWIKEYLAEQKDEKEPAEKEKKDDEDEKKDAAEEEKPEHEYELDTAYQRIRRVTSLPGDQSYFAFAPDGQHLAFTSDHEGNPRLYLIKWDGSGRKQVVGSGVGALRWTLDGGRLFYLQGGVPRSRTSSGGGAKTHSFRGEMAVSRSELARQKFYDGARQLGLRFYDETMKGLDWAGLTQKYCELALTTETIPEFNAVFNMLLGELNASHMGIYGPYNNAGENERMGYLGLFFDREFAGPGLKIARVLPRGPADRLQSKLVPGDVILEVDGQPVGPDAPIRRTLINKVGDEVIIKYLPSPNRDQDETDTPADTQPADTQPSTKPAEPEPADTQPAEPEPNEVILRPVGFRAIYYLQYDAWVESNREYIHEKTDGRIGYLHIRSMDEGSFETFERDLYAAAHGRDGLIVDVRNNGGGWTADWVMAVLNVRRHAYTIPRGGVKGYPQDRLIFYAWTKPTTMMCNQHSFSNAEIVSHAFKNLGRGPLVGTTTHGGVISTGGYRLLDGALVRLPMRGWYTLPAGIDMELNGAEPDVKVPVTPQDEVHDRRPQLDAAIKATLEQLDTDGTTQTP